MRSYASIRTSRAAPSAIAMTLMLAACSGDDQDPLDAAPIDASEDATEDADAPSSDADASPDDGSEDGAEPDAARPCDATTACGVGEYCNTARGACGGAGECEPYDPDVSCSVTPSLVCGCNGHTYFNPCDAKRRGVAIDHGERCPPVTTGCTSDVDCDDAQFCESPRGACAGPGDCVDRGITLFCAAICDPECGCDGTAYENACLRRKAGVSLVQAGTCPGELPPCTEGGACCTARSDCLPSQVCAGGDGSLDSGKCEPIMASPECWTDDDCGDDHPCIDPYVCPCGATCPRPDTPGACSS